ncbi:Mfa1 family fimbria major subunit, partial [Bacteroides fragilis]|nr:Mfa1 family fimbria major subunit [Bacteroides fragilis]
AGGQEVPQGKATEMSLIFDLSGAATRAMSDANATAGEMKITKLDVYIYNENGILEKFHELDWQNDLEEVPGEANVYTTKKGYTATTGKKTILVGANLTTNMKTLLKGTSANGLMAKGANATIAELTEGNEGFVMFSTEAAEPTLKEVANKDDVANYPTENQVAVTLQRLSAKVAVGMTKQLDVASGTQQGAAGTIADLGFLVDNTNKMFYMRQLNDDFTGFKDANLTKKDYNVADFELVDDYSALKTTDYKGITPNTPYAALGDWNVDFGSENVTTDKEMQGVTRVVVKGKFTPESGVEVTDDGQGNYTFANTPGHIADDETYYVLNLPEIGGYAFFKEADAKDNAKMTAFLKQEGGFDDTGAAAALLTMEEYKNGLNYWWVTVKDDQGDMLRNHYYKVDITSIWAPGRPDGAFDPDKDDKPIDKETNITVKVTVEPWNMVAFDADLRP